MRPNRLVRALLEARCLLTKKHSAKKQTPFLNGKRNRCLPGLGSWATLKAEPAFDVEVQGARHKGRADFLLEDEDGGRHYVEVAWQL